MCVLFDNIYRRIAAWMERNDHLLLRCSLATSLYRVAGLCAKASIMRKISYAALVIGGTVSHPAKERFLKK